MAHKIIIEDAATGDTVDVHYYCSDTCAKESEHYAGWYGAQEIEEGQLCQSASCGEYIEGTLQNPARQHPATFAYFQQVIRTLQRQRFAVAAVLCDAETGSAWQGEPERLELEPDAKNAAEAFKLVTSGDYLDGCIVASHPGGGEYPASQSKPKEHAYHCMIDSDTEQAPSQFFFDGCGCDDLSCKYVWKVIWEECPTNRAQLPAGYAPDGGVAK